LISEFGRLPLARKARWEQLVPSRKTGLTSKSKQMEGDKYDAFEKKDGPNERSLCGTVERSPRGIPEWDWGTLPAPCRQKRCARRRQRCNSRPPWSSLRLRFHLRNLSKQHSEYNWMRDILRDMPSQPWTLFNRNEGISEAFMRRRLPRKKTARRIPRRAGESQEVSSVIACRYVASSIVRHF
jgi:hypothetical protein